MNTYTVTNKANRQTNQYSTATELSKKTARQMIEASFGIGAHGTITDEGGNGFKVNSRVTAIAAEW